MRGQVRRAVRAGSQVQRVQQGRLMVSMRSQANQEGEQRRRGSAGLAFSQAVREAAMTCIQLPCSGVKTVFCRLLACSVTWRLEEGW